VPDRLAASTDVFLSYLDKKCSKCNTQPSKPAICLVCGTLLCAEGDCCKKTRCGECFRVRPSFHSLTLQKCVSALTSVLRTQTQHAIMCGGGVGLFLLAKTSGVVLITEDKSCLWGSPYFDQYGEEVRSLSLSLSLRLCWRVACVRSAGLG
jgi:E3 ubiquitin-protein ligase UBR3